MIRVCMYCRRAYGRTPEPEESPHLETHGICESCFGRTMEELDQMAKEYHRKLARRTVPACQRGIPCHTNA